MRRGIHQQERVRVLGGLPLVAVSAWLLAACDSGKKPERAATAERRQVVTATATRSAVASPVPSSAAPAARKPARKLCAGELDKPGKKLPDRPLSRRAAAGAKELPAKLAGRAGGWTWVNFWAAWCVPCKEEMPRLLGFQQKLGDKLRVVFVSLDDDARQLDDFLNSQPETGVRSTYWLVEGKERQEWLGAAEIEEDPELPTHLLVDHEGKVRCRVRGAVEDSDFASLAEIVGG